jgi:hypothetical protein
MGYNPPMADIQTPEKIRDLPLAIIKSMVALATSGFGLVVALAWNELIRKVVDSYITPYLGKNSGLVSLFIYALLMTVLAVVVTMQLTIIQRKIELLPEKLKKKPADIVAPKKAPRKKRK